MAADIQPRGLETLAAAGATTAVLDVSDGAAVGELVRTTVASHGAIGVLVNNAGIGIERRVDEHEDDEFERVLRVNLFGPYHFLRAVLPVMRSHRHGRVINVLSRHAETGAPGFAAYGSSKAALWALTRSAANEATGSGVLVNGLIPGPTKSSMNPDGPQDPDAVYPTARMLATLPTGGPSGRVFWNESEYPMFGGRAEARV
jgi:NAD(P)-dependent dehydrogenase (short-subunit alcohol dehydrogenase family)